MGSAWSRAASRCSRATERLPQMGWNTLDGHARVAAARRPARSRVVLLRAQLRTGTRRRRCRRGMVRLRTPVRRRGRARPALGHAVPPREERRGRPRAARATSSPRPRRSNDGSLSRRSTCATVASCDCSTATTTRETVYGDDPVAVARSFAEQGARWIHVVDLDAARDGGAANLSSIEAICANVEVRVQSGGGVRSVADASERFSAGVHRVVVGSCGGRASRSRRRARHAAPGPGRGRARRAGTRRRHPRLDRTRPVSTSSAWPSGSVRPRRGRAGRHRHRRRRDAHRPRHRAAHRGARGASRRR